MTRSSRFLFSSLFVVVSLPCWGVDFGDGVQAHGFLSQSVVFTSDNKIAGDSDGGGGFDLREIGGNLSWRPSSDWLISGQVLARWSGETDQGDLRLDYGFVEHNLLNTGDDRVSLALGKVKNPYGFYNTTRDVAQTRPGILMPQSIYLDRIRNFFLASPGITLRGEHDRGDIGVTWQASAMQIEADDPELEEVIFLRDLPGHFDGRRSWLGQVMTEYQGGLWRAGLSFGDVSVDYQPGTMPPFDEGSGHTSFQPWVISLQHNLEDFTLTGEYSQIKLLGQGYFNSQLNTSHTAEGWYLQGTWRLRQGWQSWLRYGEFYTDKDDKAGSHYLPVYEPYLGYSKDWVLGLRYDFTPDLALSTELHHVNGVASLSPRDNTGPPGSRFTREWDMLLLQLAWRF